MIACCYSAIRMWVPTDRHSACLDGMIVNRFGRLGIAKPCGGDTCDAEHEISILVGWAPLFSEALPQWISHMNWWLSNQWISHNMDTTHKAINERPISKLRAILMFRVLRGHRYSYFDVLWCGDCMLPESWCGWGVGPFVMHDCTAHLPMSTVPSINSNHCNLGILQHVPWRLANRSIGDPMQPSSQAKKDGVTLISRV